MITSAELEFLAMVLEESPWNDSEVELKKKLLAEAARLRAARPSYRGPRANAPEDIR